MSSPAHLQPVQRSVLTYAVFTSTVEYSTGRGRVRCSHPRRSRPNQLCTFIILTLCDHRQELPGVLLGAEPRVQARFIQLLRANQNLVTCMHPASPTAPLAPMATQRIPSLTEYCVQAYAERITPLATCAISNRP